MPKMGGVYNVIGVLITINNIIMSKESSTSYVVELFSLHGLHSLLCRGWSPCPTARREWAVGSGGAAGWYSGGQLLATVSCWVWASSALPTYVGIAAESVATLVALRLVKKATQFDSRPASETGLTVTHRSHGPTWDFGLGRCIVSWSIMTLLRGVGVR